MVEPGSDDFVEENGHGEGKRGCCSWWNFEGVAPAQGFCRLGVARGAVVMSNIFLATSLIYLAAEEAGCLTENDSYDDDCENKVHGFKPSSLISNIAVFSGLLSAFFMPVVGAIVDYTPRRKFLGVTAAVVLTLIQAAQIYTVSSTWYPMAILQAVAAFVYQAEVLSTYAYLPDTSRIVGEATMTGYTAKFTQVQFSAQMLFLIVVIGISIAMGFDDVETAHVGQSVLVLWSTIWFAIGWKCMPSMPARRELPEGHAMITEGFRQNWRTAKSINSHYSRGLRWFLLAVAFEESAAAAYTTLSVVYLDEVVGMSGTEIGIFFLITLLFTLPGSSLGAKITHKTNPKTSLRIVQVALIFIGVIGALILDAVQSKPLAYVWGMCFGVALGWFYPTENLFFSMCLPKGQEAELAGFFVYCTQIIGWLPPLIFTVIVEVGWNQKWGVVSVSGFLIVSIILLSCAAPWDEIVAEANKNANFDATSGIEGEEKKEQNNAGYPVGLETNAEA
mmetsp:Transcript_11888/g.16876  ORF Transcript_11888/g.16876 Transcript_11888/m.16876 type:complete len:504 (+) Transcript_11888:119-1630(+)